MKLIDKDVLTEKLWERRTKHHYFGGSPYSEYGHEDDEILSLINSLEVKCMDLKKEIKEQSDKYYSQCEKKLQEMDDNDKDLSFLSLDNFAKYFFELGMQVSSKEQKGEKV